MNITPTAEWLRDFTVKVVRTDQDLTARQLAVLLVVASESQLDQAMQPGRRVNPLSSVRGLAAYLMIGKPAVTRALDTLTRLGYVDRRRHPRDGRDVIISITGRGEAFVNKLDAMATAARENNRALSGALTGR